MDRIWAPWRMDYVAGEKKEACIFCQGLSGKKDLTLYQDDTTMVVLNRYPYTNGHLLVAPIRHEGILENLTRKEMGFLMETVSRSVAILRNAMNPQGFNVGLNLGEVAGAGIEEHLHIHVVPRWHGDANFISVLGETRVLSESLDRTHRKLKPQFDAFARAEQDIQTMVNKEMTK